MATVMRISMQAIAWVSELLPELPRGMTANNMAELFLEPSEPAEPGWPPGEIKSEIGEHGRVGSCYSSTEASVTMKNNARNT